MGVPTTKRATASPRSHGLALALPLLAFLLVATLLSPLLLPVAHAEDGNDPGASAEPQDLVIDWEGTDFYIRSVDAKRIGGTEAEPSAKMGQGDSAFVMVEWVVTNNMDLSRPFLAHVPTKSLTVPNQSGRVPYNGELVGSYDVKQGEDGAVDLLISLDSETLTRQSDIRGGIRVNCYTNMDPEYELLENSVCDMRFGEATCWVSYNAPDSYSMSKSMKEVERNDDGTCVARYAIDISYRGIMRNRILTDTMSMSSSIQYLDGSLTATLDGQPLDVSVTRVGQGFSVSLPDSNDGKSNHLLRIEYGMRLTAPLSMFSYLSNEAKLTYTDSGGHPSTFTRTCRTNLQPEIHGLKKVGTPIFDGNKQGNWMGFGNQYTFGMLYTISFSSSNLKLFPDEVITIEDLLGESVLQDGRYVSTDQTTYPAFQQDSTFGSGFQWIRDGRPPELTSWGANDLFYTKDGRYNGEKTNLPSADVGRYAYNACKIFQYGYDNKFTVGSLETENGQDYTLRYMIPVRNAMTIFQIDNAVNVTIGDSTSCAKTTTPVKPHSLNLITKIADKGSGSNGWHGNAGAPYVDNSQEMQYGYYLQQVANDDMRTVSYSVPVCLSHLARPYDCYGRRRSASGNGAWSGRMTGQYDWKIIDAPYQSFDVSKTSDYTTSVTTSGTKLDTTRLRQSIRNLRVEIYKSPSSTGSSIPTWSPTWEPSWKALENAYVTYALEYGTASSPKEGFDAERFQSLYSAYDTARSRDGYGSYYLGELRFDGHSSTPLQGMSSYNDIQFEFENGQIIANIGTNQITYARGYNQYLGWITGASFYMGPLYDADDYVFVLRYDLAVTDDGESLVEDDARHNGARLQLGWLDQQKDIPDYFLAANTYLSTPSGSTGSTSSKPGFYKDTYIEKKDESGYTRKITYRIGMEATNRSHIVFEDPIPTDLELLTDDDGHPDVKAVWCSNVYSIPSEPTFIDASELAVSYEDGQLTVGMDLPEEKPNKYVVFLVGTRPKLSCLTGSIRNEAYDASSGDESAKTKSAVVAFPTLPPVVHKHFVSDTWERVFQDVNPYDENGRWCAYYEIDVNPWGDDVDPAGETLLVRDDMGLSMTLVEDSVQFVSTETKEPIAGGSFEATENGWKFTVPDSQATSIRYKVALSEGDTPILHMGDSDSLRNSAVLVLGDKEYSRSTTGQSDRLMGQYAWVRSSNGSATLFKFRREGNGEVPLAGARFSLESVWDNLGNQYAGHVGDDVYATYQELMVDNAETGKVILESLPKDRIYKLTETSLPNGYRYPEGHEAGTWYFYVAGQNEADLLATDIPNDIRKGLIKVDDGGLLPIENVAIVPENPQEEPQSEPTTPGDRPDTPEKDAPKENAPEENSLKEDVPENKPAETPAKPSESGQANDAIQPTSVRAGTKGQLIQTGDAMSAICALVVIAGMGVAGYVIARRESGMGPKGM